MLSMDFVCSECGNKFPQELRENNHSIGYDSSKIRCPKCGCKRVGHTGLYHLNLKKTLKSIE